MTESLKLIKNKSVVLKDMAYFSGRIKILSAATMPNKSFRQLIKDYKAELADLEEVLAILNL